MLSGFLTTLGALAGRAGAAVAGLAAAYRREIMVAAIAAIAVAVAVGLYNWRLSSAREEGRKQERDRATNAALEQVVKREAARRDAHESPHEWKYDCVFRDGDCTIPAARLFDLAR